MGSLCKNYLPFAITFPIFLAIVMQLSNITVLYAVEYIWSAVINCISNISIPVIILYTFSVIIINQDEMSVLQHFVTPRLCILAQNYMVLDLGLIHSKITLSLTIPQSQP